MIASSGLNHPEIGGAGFGVKQRKHQPMIKFNAKKLAATAIAQATKDEPRQYLRGVYFNGTYAVATNGHILTISHDPDSQVDKNGIYTISKKAISAMKKETAETVTIRDGGLSVFNKNDFVLFTEDCIEIGGTYSDYHRVIPSDRGGATLALFSTALMRRVCETQKILGGFSFRITGENDTAHCLIQ